mgnify:CR=1 FL=1
MNASDTANFVVKPVASRPGWTGEVWQLNPRYVNGPAASRG